MFNIESSQYMKSLHWEYFGKFSKLKWLLLNVSIYDNNFEKHIPTSYFYNRLVLSYVKSNNDLLNRYRLCDYILTYNDNSLLAQTWKEGYVYSKLTQPIPLNDFLTQSYPKYFPKEKTDMFYTKLLFRFKL